MLVSALLRRAHEEGGSGAVLAKGDPTAGSVTVILAEKGKRACVLERLLLADGRYAWEESRQAVEDEAQFRAFLERRRKYDPDLWIVELDIASAERFAAEMNAVG
ncbi:MAG TPA: DUF1491 family protein [Allosphingosinicella sp.]|nr:DUF1491 family protein [Allosphingosinicella sp.]